MKREYFLIAGVVAFVLFKGRDAVAKGFSMDKLAEWAGLKTARNLSRVTRDMLNNQNVRAFLRVIRAGESSNNDYIAYRMIVGKRGAVITSFEDHPRIFGTPVSTAAGAYQITKTTWDWIRGPMKLSDFTPANQDFAALGLIAYRGALADVMAGRLDSAIKKLRAEWTSLPGASENYGITLAEATNTFRQFGGAVA